MAIRKRTSRRGPKRPKPQRLYKVVCASCRKEVMLEVPPPADKKLLCIDCYKK